jgi:hypothetical protein
MRGIRVKGPKVKWDNLSIDQHISDEVTKRLYDHVHQRPIYGARSQLINRLLSEWLEKQDEPREARTVSAQELLQI